MRTRFGGKEEVLRSRERLVWRADRRAPLKLIVAADAQVQIQESKEREGGDAQEKVEAPATRVTRNIRAQTAVQPTPTLVGADVT